MKLLGTAGSVSRKADLKDWLEQEILDGRLRPGDSINEQEVCRSFGVSRTPLREALLQLGSMGLVSFIPRQGAVVARMSVKQLVAMWETLTGLEGFCAGLAARRMTGDDHSRVSAIHERAKRFVEQGDVASYDSANREFHEAVYEGCRNEFLAQQTKDIRRRLRLYRRYPFERPGGMERSLQGHQQVIEALLAGDEKLADMAMRDHVVGGLSFLDFVADLPEELSIPEARHEFSDAEPRRLAAASRSKVGRSKRPKAAS
jgi:DNA-binding GntR family transcriptional regulator